MANYTYSKLAAQDLDSIAEYTYLNFGEHQTRAYRVAIDQSASTVARFPAMGRSYTTKSGVSFQRYNVGEHTLFFQKTEDGIFIVRVLHLMMDFDRHLDR